MKKINRIVFLTLVIYGLSSCLKDKTIEPINPECIGLTVSYNENVKPLIVQSCATNQGPGTGCHDAWIFEYSNVIKSIKNGSFEHRVFDLVDMPPVVNSFNIQPLTEDEFNVFKCWIADGYPDN